MNLILMRSKVDHLNAWWEPDATSTPLRKIPDELEIEKKAQKQDRPVKTKFLDSKRSRKSRLSTYFDPSSSSDEDDDSGEIKRRPIIKLSSKESSTKLLLRSKEPEEEEIKIINSSPRGNLGNINKCDIKIGKNILVADNPKNQNNQVKSSKNRTQTETNLTIESICSDSDEENIILNKCTKNKYLLKENKTCIKRKANVMNCSQSGNSKHPSDFNDNEKKDLHRINKTHQVLMNPKQVKINTKKNSKTLRNCQKISTGNSKLSKFCKKKNLKIIGSADSLRNQTRNSASETVKTKAQMLNTINPLLTRENKSNLSHQLFSESTEQEYIDILNLTSDEGNEANERSFLQRGSNSICQPFIWPYHSSHKICIENKGKEGRSIQKKQTQKYGLQNDHSPKLSTMTTEKKAESMKILPQSDGQIQKVRLSKNGKEIFKGKNTENNCKIKNYSLRNKKDQNFNKKQGLTNVTENETLSGDSKNIKESALNCTSSSPDMDMDMDVCIQSNEICITDTLKCVKDKNTVDSSEKSVFKQLDELSFNKNESGCSVVQCWNVKNVKCGVFKLNTQSQFVCQTLHSNSYLGGVLVKGHLRMKIDIKEQDLKEGDMVFIPPLTEWRATNIGECESVFYYWCGRFGQKLT